MERSEDFITLDQSRTLAGLFRERVKRTPDRVAYRQFNRDREIWEDMSWKEMGVQVARWQAAMEADGLEPGDRVSVMMRNCREWVMLDQAALGLGLVVVPLYNDDRGDNVAYILDQTDVKLLIIEGDEQWCKLDEVKTDLHSVKRIVCIDTVDKHTDDRLTGLDTWLPESGGELRALDSDSNALATIVFTSGTTGRPKGVMLSHMNILSNGDAAYQLFLLHREDLFLSFLPLSHMLERTAGYYLAMMCGGTVAYARSIPQLAEDLVNLSPTILISVPRIFERVYGRIQGQLEEKSPVARALFNKTVEVGWARFEHSQGRRGWTPSLLLWPILKKLVASKIQAKLGGRLRIAVSGGAPLSATVARVFIGLGVPIYQGYGLTESSPLITVNCPDRNFPASIGPTAPGVEVRVGDKDELLARGPNIMLGYWQNEQATKDAIDADGWLHTGDKASERDGYWFITGRLKEIIVLANGEKAPPADMELAIANNLLFDQVMIVGEGRPYLTALIVLNPEVWESVAAGAGLDQADANAKQAQALALERIADALHEFPGYATIRQVTLTLEPWTVVNDLITPTLKLKRAKILEHHTADVDDMYAGHG